MTLEERLKQIEEHFQTISDEDLEQNLIKAGMGIIQPSGCLTVIKNQ